MSDTPAPTKTYKASCHCGAFAYDVTTDDLDNEKTEVTRCNCSICMRNGYLFIYVPNDNVTFTSGRIEDLKVHCAPFCLIFPNVLRTRVSNFNALLLLLRFLCFTMYCSAIGKVADNLTSRLIPSRRTPLHTTSVPPAAARASRAVSAMGSLMEPVLSM